MTGSVLTSRKQTEGWRALELCLLGCSGFESSYVNLQHSCITDFLPTESPKPPSRAVFMSSHTETTIYFLVALLVIIWFVKRNNWACPLTDHHPILKYCISQSWPWSPNKVLFHLLIHNYHNTSQVFRIWRSNEMRLNPMVLSPSLGLYLTLEMCTQKSRILKT